MASREKRPLAPSKSKQKANNDSSSLSAADNSRSTSKKSKSLGNPRTQLAREILEAVATGSQLPAKLEASLPRKRALQTALKRKQKAKKTLIKVKQKVPIKTLKRTIVDAKKILNRKKKAKSIAQIAQNSADNAELEDTKKCKTAKKPKAPAKAEEADSEVLEKSSPKLSKKVIESSPKATKAGKAAAAAAVAAQKRNDSKEREPKVKRSLSKEPEELKQIKIEPNDNSYELTIEEVIASSMLVKPKVEAEGEESASEGELKGKRNIKNSTAKRSLRNGKLRQSLPKAETDTDPRKLSTMSEASSVEVNEESKAVRNPESGSSSVNLDPSDIDVVVKVEHKEKEEENSTAAANHVADATELIETNNNGCESSAEAEHIEEIGPTLRSKTKARSSDGSASSDADIKLEDGTGKPVTVKSEMDVKKELRAFSKYQNELKIGVGGNNKSRRSSMNADMRRSSLADGGSKSQIDEMIDQIKLTIAKSIESKIYKPDSKGMILGKSFEVPKLEDIIVPLSNDVSTPKLEGNAEEDKPNLSKSRELTTGIGPNLAKKEIKAEDGDNTVPKVADTAKEIEKLVMGETEPADPKPPMETVEDQPSEDVAAVASSEPANVSKIAEEPKNVSTPIAVDDDLADKSSSDLQSSSTEKLDDSVDKDVKQPEETKKSTPVCPTRKSQRVTAGKSSLTPEMKKSLSIQDISKELEKQEPEEEKKTTENEKAPETQGKLRADEKTTIEDTTSKEASNSEGDESVNENKTDTAVEVSAEAPKESESSTLEVANEEMEVDEPVAAEKNEETLESLSREVEKLVEEDENSKVPDETMESADNDASSDIEMRLMIDEEVPESANEEKESNSPQQQISDNNDGCDPKSSTESPDNVQKVEATVKSTSGVQENPETETTTAKSAVTDDKSKDVTSKAKLTEAEEIEEQKENRRVLRARGDKQKKLEAAKSVPAVVAQEKSETKANPDDAANSEVPSITTQENNTETDNVGDQSQTPKPEVSETTELTAVVKIEPEEQPEPQIRTRRSREVKKQVQMPVTKGKRGPKKQDAKKMDPQQQTKEESLLDNEVATINENDRSSDYIKTNENLRGVSANAGNAEQQKVDVPDTKNRSKSENDVRSTNLSGDILKPENALPTVVEAEPTDADSKGVSPKDSDEASTSGDSLSSVEKLYETPEDRAKKEDILRQLGLESWEKVKERKAKKEQQYTGTLKTIIRLQKEKEGKKRSRSPLKMVLKQQGDESFDYYTIQKEFGGPSGMGDSSSGANRKLSTNPRHSCDEDNDEAPLKDRQSLVIPEKSSSFSIHPGRLCADNCCYCHGKFGSLDTPMHLAQMKSDARRKKIMENEVHLTKDSCLCDACYRHVDRKANMSPTMQLKPQRQNRQSIMKCVARNCTESVRHYVKRRWLLKLKPYLRDLVDINWESSQHNLMTFCGTHYGKIERFLTCTLCKRRLTRSSTYSLGLSAEETSYINQQLRAQGVPATMVFNTFVCRLCRFFIRLQLKHSDFNSMSDNNKDFHKKYRKKLMADFNIVVPESEEETESSNQASKNKDKNGATVTNKKAKCNSSSIKILGTSKSPDNLETNSTSASDKSSPEPPKIETIESETNSKEESAASARCLGIESAIEKLKKRKALDTIQTSRSVLNSSSETTANNGSGRDVVEILAMDKEVTLTRLPKKPRLSNTSATNDISPVVQRLGANPSISVRTLFPGEEEMNLHANVEFSNVREVTPHGWEKCATMIQYDRDTKLLWQELQRPYGNQSSFLRHLILLEKYYRAGDLILAPNASRNAINYSTSVQNRLISYEGPENPPEPVNAIEYNNSRRLSGGYMLEQRDQRPSATISTNVNSSNPSSSYVHVTSQSSKLDPTSRVMKLTPGVSIIKKPPPSLQRLNLNNSGGGLNGSAKRKESIPVQKGASSNTTGGKVFQLTEPDFKRLQSLKRQKQMMNERQASSPNSGSGSSNSPPSNYKTATSLAAQYQKVQQLSAQSQFQKHLRMQQEMLNQRSRGDFEPLICDMRTLSNENTPTQNLINNLNLPKSIQVTTKLPSATSTPIPILPKIPKSLTVIPQTVSRAQDK